MYYTWNPDYSGYVATDPPPAGEPSGAASAPDAPPPAGAGAYPAYPNGGAPNGAYPPNGAYSGPAAPQAAPQGAPQDAAPPAGPPPADPAVVGQQARIFMYPKNGQSAEQQSTDRRECQQWAAQQAGTDGASAPDYQRAMTACIEGRGYSVN